VISAFTLRIIILLVALSGLIAYIGNRVGKYIGKRRVTIFGLRPRYTAMIITVISGILIALGTVGTMVALSENVRLALLGLDRLQQEIGRKNTELQAANLALEGVKRQQLTLEQELTASKREAAQLQTAKQRLSAEITTARQGEVLFKRGEVISLSLIQSGPDPVKLKEGLSRIIANADDGLRALGLKTAGVLVTVDPENFNDTAYMLLGDKKTYIVKLVADSNSVWGDTVPAVFELAENKLVYRAGSEIASGEVSGGLTQAQIEAEVMKLLRASHQAARESGVIPDPSGSIGSIPYAQISDAARRVRNSGRKMLVRVLAQKETYAIGPLAVELKVSGR